MTATDALNTVRTRNTENAQEIRRIETYPEVDAAGLAALRRAEDALFAAQAELSRAFEVLVARPGLPR